MSQTFSEKVKEEICCENEFFINDKIVIYTILKILGEYDLSNCLELKITNFVILKIIRQFCLDSNLEYIILVSNKKTLKTNRIKYLIKIQCQNNNNNNNSLLNFVNWGSIIKTQNFNSVLIGFFLVNGSITKWNNTYHLEFRIEDGESKDIVLECLKKVDLKPNILVYRNKYLIYFKKIQYISDLLKIFKANQTMFELEDKKIERDFLNNYQRLVNLDVSNMNKIAKSSVEQHNICRVVKSSIFFETLTSKEQLYCITRLENKNMSMQQICEIMNTKLPDNQKISKGSLSHIVKKIKDIYEQI